MQKWNDMQIQFKTEHFLRPNFSFTPKLIWTIQF